MGNNLNYHVSEGHFCLITAGKLFNKVYFQTNFLKILKISKDNLNKILIFKLCIQQYLCNTINVEENFGQQPLYDYLLFIN